MEESVEKNEKSNLFFHFELVASNVSNFLLEKYST